MFSKWVNAFVNVRSFARLLTYSLRSFDVTAAIRSTRKVNVSCYYRACYTDRITCLFVRVCYKQAIYKVLSTLYTIKLPYATPRRRSVACVCSCLNLTCFPIILYSYIDIIKNIFELNTLRFKLREIGNSSTWGRISENTKIPTNLTLRQVVRFLQLGNLKTWDSTNLETRKGGNIA